MRFEKEIIHYTMTIKEMYPKSLWFQWILASVVGMLVYNTFTYAEDAQEWMPDTALRAAVREALELPAEAPLSKEHMLQLDSFWAQDKDISNITGLELAINLKELYLSQNPIADLGPLANLTALKSLHLWTVSSSNTPPLDLRPLATLINLEELSLGNSRISDISPLVGLTKLQELYLSHNNIENIQSLVGLTELRTLSIEGNLITDFTPLRGTSLIELDLSNTSITDLHPLATLINLEALFLVGNGISDISPLAELTKLQHLDLSNNDIEDLRPLSGLAELRTLWIKGNPITDFMPLAGLNLTDLKYDVIDEPTEQTDPAEAWMPDAALRAAVRGEIGLLPGISLRKEKLQAVSYINIAGKSISNITGLEFATNLRELDISSNPITDLRPLSELTTLEILDLSDLSADTLNLDIGPLASLVNLEELALENSRVSDISPLAGLTKLQHLDISNNQILDFSPLVGLTQLWTLRIQGNWTRDLTPLAGLTLIDFQYDEICEIPPPGPPVIQRIFTKNYPALYETHGFVAETPEEYEFNSPSIDPELYNERITKNDLYFTRLALDYVWPPDAPPYSGLGTRFGGNLERSRTWRETQLALNPNLVFLVQPIIRPELSDFPSDTNLLLRDTDGQLVDWSDEYHFDILRPEVQQFLIDKFVGVAECGVYDGIFIDGFRHNGIGDWVHIYAEFVGKGITAEDIIEVYRHIFRSVRERVRPDFLILVNAAVTQTDRLSEFINGAHMEAGTQHLTTYRGLKQLEAVLSWNEENFREPRINGLECAGWEGPNNSPKHQRRMRLTTTLSLTHSDGYVDYKVLYKNSNGGFGRYAPWYDFWDADLGQPIGKKGQLCDSCDGLFIREFTNGWAVYNRSGKPQKIQLPMQAIGVASGLTSTIHIVPDLDGEMYLKQETHITGDSTVKVLEIEIATPQESASEWMPDPALRAAVREALELPVDIPLTKEHMLRFDDLRAQNKGISDITGLEFATNLRRLRLSRNPITNLRPLANLTTLENLYLSDISPNTPTLDIGPLATLVNLEALSLDSSKISDISPLANLKKLSILHLSNNQISDISPLTGLTELRELSIKGNLVTDFSPLGALNLTELRSDVDVNDDGVINIQDLVIVANALGKAEPDLNGDGVVNIQDLVIVANAF